MNKKVFLLSLFLGLSTVGLFAQTPCGSVNCNNTPCTYTTPCTAENGELAPCFTPEMGCDYTNCNTPALIDRYAYLAHKYNEYGPSERATEIAKNNSEVIELQNLDRHFSTTNLPSNLSEEQLLKLKTAQGAIIR